MELVEDSGYKFTIGYTTYNRKDLIIMRLEIKGDGMRLPQ
jgi:hypothetical protein